MAASLQVRPASWRTGWVPFRGLLCRSVFGASVSPGPGRSAKGRRGPASPAPAWDSSPTLTVMLATVCRRPRSSRLPLRAPPASSAFCTRGRHGAKDVLAILANRVEDAFGASGRRVRPRSRPCLAHLSCGLSHSPARMAAWARAWSSGPPREQLSRQLACRSSRGPTHPLTHRGRIGYTSARRRVSEPPGLPTARGARKRTPTPPTSLGYYALVWALLESAKHQDARGRIWKAKVRRSATTPSGVR